MKVKRANEPGKVTVELDQDDDALLEQSATGAHFHLRTILVPLDFSSFSSKALAYANAFADQFGADVTLLHVVEPMVYPENCLSVPSATDDINGSLIQAAEKRLSAQVEALGSGGRKVATMTRLGRPFIEITEAARELEADLIILATHGHTGLKQVLLGSTAERVVRHAPCPVLTVRDPEHDFVSS
jgi:nucleotide-binding universal stress UspA family protein